MNLVVDTLVLVGYVIDDAFRFTGLMWHEWIGMALIVMFGIHVVLHADWVVRITKRMFQRLPPRERLTWIIDVVLFVSMGFVLISGILISRKAMPFVGWTPGRDRFWTGMHTTFASLVVFAVAAHMALGWKWVTTVFRGMFRGRRPRRRGVAPAGAVVEVTA